MKVLFLICFFLLACFSNSRAEGSNIDSLFQSLNKGEVSISERPLSFANFSTMNEDDTTCYVVGDNIEGVFIAYCQGKGENYSMDMLHVNGRNYRLFGNPEDDKTYDMQVEKALLYHIRTKTRHYVCIAGQLIQQKNKSPEITSFVLLDITDPGKLKIGQLLSYFSSIYSFADLDNDGELDFIRVKPDRKNANRYVAEACDLDGANLPAGSRKPHTLSLELNEGNAEIKDSRWFK